MTPAARHAAAIGVLDAWADGVAAEQALTRWARGARYAGSGDRAAVRDLVYDVLRQKGNCAAFGGGTDGRALILGLMRLRGADPAAVFTGALHAPPPLTAAEDGAPDVTPDPARDVPDWMLPLLAARMGAELPRLLAAMGTRAPVYLRVNRRKADSAAALARLAEDGVNARAVPGCDTALEVTDGPRRLRGSAAYGEGWVELQDLSAQRAVATLPWPATGKILDYCAGGGGKTLAIADRTGAAVFAHDALPRRMADLPARAARAGVGLDMVGTADLARHASYDAVLCDVPCSGSGTWRRDPEAKWRLSPGDLDRLIATQADILAAAAPLVAPGGMLAYMTCSLFEAENEGQVAAFEAGHPGWRRLVQRIDTPLSASDGFFAAAWQAPEGSAA